MMEAEQIAKGAGVLVQVLSQAEYDRDEGNIARADFLDVVAARITDLEAQLAARDAEIVRLKVMIGRIIEAAEDDPDYALPEAINEVQAEMVLDALHANGFTARPTNGDR